MDNGVFFDRRPPREEEKRAVLSACREIIDSSLANQFFIVDHIGSRVVAPLLADRLRLVNCVRGGLFYTWMRVPWVIGEEIDPSGWLSTEGYLFLVDVAFHVDCDLMAGMRALRRDLRDQGISQAGEIVGFRRQRSGRFGYGRAI